MNTIRNIRRNIVSAAAGPVSIPTDVAVAQQNIA